MLLSSHLGGLESSIYNIYNIYIEANTEVTAGKQPSLTSAFTSVCGNANNMNVTHIWEWNWDV